MPRKKTGLAKNAKTAHKNNDTSQQDLQSAEALLVATTALLDGAKTGEMPVVTEVLDKWGAQIEPHFLGHALKGAAQCGQPAVIDIILTQFSEKISPEDKGMALRFAADAGHLDSVRILRERCGQDISSYMKGQAFFLAAEKHLDVACHFIDHCFNEIDQDFKLMAFDVFVEKENLTLIDELLKKFDLLAKQRFVTTFVYTPATKISFAVYLHLIENHGDLFTKVEKHGFINRMVHKPVDSVPYALYLRLVENHSALFSSAEWYLLLTKAVGMENPALLQKVFEKLTCERYVEEDNLKMLDCVIKAGYPERVLTLLNNHYTKIPWAKAGHALISALRLSLFDSAEVLLHRFKNAISQEDLVEAYRKAKADPNTPIETKQALFEALTWPRKLRHENPYRVCAYYIKVLWHKIRGIKQDEESSPFYQPAAEPSEDDEIVLTQNPPSLRFSVSDDFSDDVSSELEGVLIQGFPKNEQYSSEDERTLTLPEAPVSNLTSKLSC